MTATKLKNILITGANTGIGFATTKALIENFDDTYIFLGSRNLKKGQDAVNDLVNQNSLWKDRVSCLQVDVSSDQSVEAAARELHKLDTKLYGIVNNAGVAGKNISESDVININVFGPWRVFNQFVGLMQDSGRIVNISSASGPNFISNASNDIKDCLLDPHVTWDQIKALTNDYLNNNQKVNTRSNLSPVYGFSKACLNAYTVYLANKFPSLIINACTPGFIETNLTRPFLTSSGKSASELGMKSPDHASKVITHLLMDNNGSGYYYGSDAVRSPLDRYRAPGDPPYTGA